MKDTEDIEGRSSRVDEPAALGEGSVSKSSPGGGLGELHLLAAQLQLLAEQPPEQARGDVVDDVSQQVIVGNHVVAEIGVFAPDTEAPHVSGHHTEKKHTSDSTQTRRQLTCYANRPLGSSYATH